LKARNSESTCPSASSASRAARSASWSRPVNTLWLFMMVCPVISTEFFSSRSQRLGNSCSKSITRYLS